MNKDDFGDRMKSYEMAEAGRSLMPLLPIIARIDGKSFSKFTRGLGRPFDERLSRLMIDTVQYLVLETNAVLGYTQSDEITLAWYYRNYEQTPWFGGRTQKMCSVLASITTAYFNANKAEILPEKKDRFALFDCRVWNVPNIVEAANCFLWREQDATKNAISMAANHYYSHNELHKKNGSDMQEMLWQKNINFNDYPAFFKRGTYVKRKKIEQYAPNNELVIRTKVEALEIPPLGTIANRVGFIFNNEPIEVASEKNTKDREMLCM